MKHPLADTIHAWADGEEIEFYRYGEWSQINAIHHYFDPDLPYRIKPKIIKKEAEVVIYKHKDGVYSSYLNFNGPTTAVYNATLIKVIPIEWEEEA